MRKLTVVLAMALAFVGGVFSGVTWNKEPTLDELKLRYDGYRLCMQTAHICQMGVPDFIDYYRIQKILENADEASH